MPFPNTPTKPNLNTPINTPTGDTKTTSSTTGRLPIHHIFATNRMPVEDADAQERHPEVLQWAEKIQGGDRSSITKTGSDQKIKNRSQEYADANEDTWTKMFFAALKKETRDRNVVGEWSTVQWDQDGLREVWNQLFQKNSIPKIDTSDAATEAILNKYPRIKRPKPDITYGLSSKEFSNEMMTINRLYYEQAGICPSLWHPFCIVEANMKGRIEDAIYQCVRGGAALVNAARQLKFLSGDLKLTTSGADLLTPVFSLAAVPTSIALQVHWAEVDSKGQTWFHMHHVYTYALRNRGEGKKLRHDLNNILDWGTLSRKDDIITMLTKISDAHIAGTIRQLPTPEVTEVDEDKDCGDNDSDADVFADAIEGTDQAGEDGASRGDKKRKLDERA